MFADKGYDRATIRGIASHAGVDPSLIHHYFGSKDGLFAATLDLPRPPAELIQSMLADAGDDLGVRLATTFFSVWEEEAARASLLGILRSAIGGEDHAVAAFREFITRELQAGIAPLIDHDDAELRALLMASHLVGVAMTRYVVKFEPIASTPIEDLVALISPRIQSYVDDD